MSQYEDTFLNSLTLNVLTQNQFDNLAEKNANELYLIKDAPEDKGIYYIEGNTEGTAGKWTGEHNSIKEYYPGLVIAYKIGIQGASTTKLDINGLGEIKVVRNQGTNISTTYGVRSVVILIYTEDGEERYWKTADYSTNFVTQKHTEDDKVYPLLFKYNAGIIYTSDNTTLTRYNNQIYVNPYLGSITANEFIGPATSANKAEKDGADNVITDTYMAKVNPTGSGSFSLNRKTDTSIGDCSYAIGYNTTASGLYSYAEGDNTSALKERDHAEGNRTTASGGCSHAEGNFSTASGYMSHAEGEKTTASGMASHAQGSDTVASGEASHAEGEKTTAFGRYSHAEGQSYNILPSTITAESTDEDIIAEWNSTDFSYAKGVSSHVEGRNCLGLGDSSHAEGGRNLSLGECSHAEGFSVEAKGRYSHAEGVSTIATAEGSHVEGKHNIIDNDNEYLHIAGNGTDEKKSNAFTLDWNGNAWFSGDVYIGSESKTNKDTGSKKLATEEYVDSLIGSILNGAS